VRIDLLVIWGFVLATVVVAAVLGLAIYFAIWGEEIEIDIKSFPPSITAGVSPRTNYRARWPEVPMPKTPAWRPAARRRDYERRRDWHLFLVKQWQASYAEYHGHPYRPPGRKATCQRYEDRRRKSRARKRHMAKVLKDRDVVLVKGDLIPRAVYEQRQQQVKDQAQHTEAMRVWREQQDRRAARGLNELPPPEKPRTGLSPGSIGRIRRF
jgi:hypothetical protein